MSFELSAGPAGLSAELLAGLLAGLLAELLAGLLAGLLAELSEYSVKDAISKKLTHPRCFLIFAIRRGIVRDQNTENAPLTSKNKDAFLLSTSELLNFNLNYEILLH